MFNPFHHPAHAPPRHHHGGAGAPLQRLSSRDDHAVTPPPLMHPRQPPWADIEAGGSQQQQPAASRSRTGGVRRTKTTLVKPERAIAQAPMIQAARGGSGGHAGAPPRVGAHHLGFSDSSLPPSLLPLSHKLLLPTTSSKRARQSKTARPTRRFSLWHAYSRALTCLVPDAILRRAPFHRDSRETRQAWREKIALCLSALALGGLVVFITMFLNRTFCPDSAKVDAKLMSELGSTSGTVGVYGWQIQVGSSSPAAGSSGPNLSSLSTSSPGTDVTPYFSRSASDFPACSGLSTRLATANLCSYVDPSGVAQGCPLGTIGASASSLGLSNTSLYVGYSWSQTAALEDHVVLNGWVLNLKPYVDAVPSAVKGDGIDGAIRAGLSSGIAGARDVTRALYDRGATSREIACITQRYAAGRLDRMSPGCFFAQLSLYATLVVILGIVLIRFAMAATFHWLMAPRMARPPQSGSSAASDLWTMCLVTCYSEGEAGIRATLESIADADYPDARKLLFVVADGRVTGKGETQSTPDICLGLMAVDTARFGGGPPEPMGYMAVGSGSQRENRARVYAGHFLTPSGRRTPMILVSKCGNVDESSSSSSKPGNRGKRDSQMIAMRFLQSVLYDDAMSPLDYELFRKVQALMGVTPDAFEVMLMVDADTVIYPSSLRSLVNCMLNDPSIIGVCGETRIANAHESWVTRIQVFEYFISHHMAKAFESVFGGVTCLPGCFSMYRIKARRAAGDWVPVLANRAEVVREYSQNDVDNLHAKSLLSLGEDRFLTTLLIRTFPSRKMVWCPAARCKTTVPASFRVLASQRRRWTVSTIHNLVELLKVRNLCGTFCFSMQFVVACDLFGTLVLPVAICLTYALVVNSILSPPHSFQEAIPILLLGAVLGLPGVLVLLTSRQISYIGWMLLYFVSLPIWNFALPVIAFWRWDDVSWGDTRRVEGENVQRAKQVELKRKKTIKDKTVVFDETQVPLRKWGDWERSRLRKIRRMERRRKHEQQRQQQRTNPLLSPGDAGDASSWDSHSQHSSDEDVWGEDVGGYNEDASSSSRLGHAEPPPLARLSPRLSPDPFRLADEMSDEDDEMQQRVDDGTMRAILERGFDAGKGDDASGLTAPPRSTSQQPGWGSRLARSPPPPPHGIGIGEYFPAAVSSSSSTAVMASTGHARQRSQGTRQHYHHEGPL